MSRRVPAALVAAQVLLAAVAAGHLVVIGLTLAGQAALRRDLAADRPPGSDIEQIAATSTTTALGVHVPLLVLTTVLAAALRSGHPWVLRPATVSQAFAVPFSRLSTPPLHLLDPLVPAAVVAAVVVLGLLWVPARSRAFFASHPRSRSSRRSRTSTG